MVAVCCGAHGWGGGGCRVARRSLVPRVVERLMYADCATRGASCGGLTRPHW